MKRPVLFALNVKNNLWLLLLLFCIQLQSQINTVSPQQGATFINTNVNFNWSPINNASSYELEISTDASFTNIVLNPTNILQTSLLIPHSTFGSYFWRARAVVNSIPSGWSNILGYKIINLNPTNTLKLWWDADDSLTINSGSFVSRWGDKSGNNNYGFQTDLTKQPKRTDSVINNHAVVNFDGNIQSIITNTFTLNQPNTFFLVFNKKNMGPNEYMTDGININNFRLSVASDNTYLFYAGNFFPSNNTTGAVGYKVFTLSENGSNSFMRGNFIDLGTGDPGNMAIQGLTLGTYGIQTPNPAVHADLDVAEVLIFNDALPLNQITEIEDYLKSKYAPPVSLGKDIISTDFCTKSLTTQGAYSSYLWNTGEITKKINVTKAGIYWVTCVDLFGFSSSDTINVSYPIYNHFSDSLFCSGNSIKWDTELPKSQFSFLWNTSSTDSLLNISLSGDYHVKITDTFGCFIESDTITATTDNFSTIASLGPDTSLCAGNAISLKVGDQPGLNYEWNDNSTNPSLTIATSGQYSAIVTNTNNCVAKDTINVTIIGQAPTASFINSVACKNNSVTFTDNSTASSGNTISSWFWNYGDGTTLADTSHFQNPNYTYADTGNFNVNLTITTNVGCKQVLIQNVHVAPKPTVNYNNIIACKNDSAVFTNSITTFGYPTTSYLWNFGDPASGAANTSTLPNLKHLFSQQTIYPVKLIATNSAGCKDSITKNINVRAQVTASFTNTSACSKGSITFQDNSIVPAPNSSNIRNWNFGTSTATGLTVTKTFSLGGTYPITLTVTGSNGCISSITQSINVMLPPVAEFTLPSICSKDTATAVDQSIAQNGTITSWTWKLDNIPFSSVQNPTLSPIATTAYSVKLIITNSFNCVDSITKTFYVYPLPAVDFVTNPVTYYYPNQPIVFTPTNPTGVLYNWTINSIPYSVQSPTVIITTPGTYTANLFQKNNLGCGNTKSKTINVLNPYLDLALLETNATKSSNNYYSVSTDLANFGTLAISSFDISYQISDAGSIQETWNGLLNPGEFMTYQFTAKTLAKNTSDGNIACVNIESVNTINDHNLSNNKQCVTENSNSIVVSNPYPNPTDGDITLPIILNKDTEYTYELFDALGQIVLEETIKKGTAGLNLVPIPTSALRRGCYLLKITINDKTYIKKVLKNIAE